MPRVLTSGMQTQIAADNAEFVYLLEFEFSGTFVRLSTAPLDLPWNGVTWSGVGGFLTFTAVEETTDDKGQGTEIRLSGVNSSITAVLLAQAYIGRKVSLWKAYLSGGAVVNDPISYGSYIMNSGFEITEDVDADPPTVTISSRVVSRLALFDQERGIRTNVQSHQRIYSGDTFFSQVAALPLTPIYWGMDYPPGAPIRT